MVANAELCELIGALESISTTLSEMSLVLEAQREAVFTNDLSRLLYITNEQEELTARLKRCERRRRHTQEHIEHELGATGVFAIVASLPESLHLRIRLSDLISEIGRQVRALHEHSHRSSQLLKASIQQAERSRSDQDRSYLELRTGQRALQPSRFDYLG
jgi:hypothetical protein